LNLLVMSLEVLNPHNKLTQCLASRLITFLDKNLKVYILHLL